jgi:hypothetical protein
MATLADIERGFTRWGAEQYGSEPANQRAGRVRRRSLNWR